ncbi:ABC transporter ATP-binding protein [Tessaracoccus antarcticus]|uniref:ABC transporter ATP-binding protein n=1 Tax=Tessaracoccus antarcticus TaxID=2479848 RepID=A0A3M0GCB1_9ACTN|nr:ABC transporter ATP-binding protein [Tessaracoccus antarcticus]
MGLSKHYGTGSAEVVALDDVDFEVISGEFTAIMGPSGSGKSTLMHLMAALDSPTSGSVFIGDTDVASLKDGPLTELRRDRIGFIFQAFNLVPTLSAQENIVLPLAIAGKKVDQEWFDRIVSVLGLGNRLTHKPSELSGGQQQRVACARALMNRPDIVFGDEPTGNLDSTAAAEVLSFLRRSVDEFGQTVVMVTHDALSASYADRQVFLSDGHIIEELRNATQDELLQTMARIYPRHDRLAEAEQSVNGKEPDGSASFVEWKTDSLVGVPSSPHSPSDDVVETDGDGTRGSHPEHAIFRDGSGAPEETELEDNDEFEQTTPRRAILN